MTTQTFYFQQGFHDIDVLDTENVKLLHAKRSINWLGKINTEIKFDDGEIIATNQSFPFFIGCKIIKNSTGLEINFMKNKKVLKVGNHIIAIKHDKFIGRDFFVTVDDRKICKVYSASLLSLSSKLKYKIELLEESHLAIYILIFLCLTEDIQFS